MSQIIDLTHTITTSMPVHPLDESPSIEKICNLADNKYNDWRLTSGMHVGTHIDGPGHLTNSPVLLSELSIDRFVGKGYLIDARNEPIDTSLLHDMPSDEGLIVLILTGMDKHFGTQNYFTNHPIIPTDVAHKLAKRKIKMIGIDFFSPDNYPFALHHLFFSHDILIIENLTNLDQLVGIKNFTVYALPLKTNTDSALARVVAVANT
jgi:kynurenine formamidase